MVDAEVIDGEATEVENPRSLVVMDQGMAATGPLALAGLTDEEFDRRLAALDTMRTRVERMQKALMVLDVDYGVIPGTGTKPTLLKPGAEKLCQAYGLAADFQPKRTTGDGETVPHLSYVTRCELHLGSLDGLTIAVGYGAANSWERKHRYRRDERVCPSCGQKTIIKGKAEYGGGWVCFKKKGGCGQKWLDGATEIEGQTVGDIENPDPFDLDVVLAKMSEKRAFIDATLRATAASGLFTQDIEDLGRPDVDTPPPPDVETETLVGDLTRTGTVKRRDKSALEALQGPDGHVIVFRLEIAKDKQIPQVVLQGQAGEAFYLASAMKPDAMVGHRITVKGRLFNVTRPGRSAYYRLHVFEWETDDFRYPPESEPEPEPVEPREAESVPLFRGDDDLSDLDFR